MIYIGVDPGVRECGVAIEYDVAPISYIGLSCPLHQAFLVKSDLPSLGERAVAMALYLLATSHLKRVSWPTVGPDVSACIEGQQFYGTERSKGDPNDLIRLGQVAGIMLGALSQSVHLHRVALPLPRQWKGSTPKTIHHTRLKRDYPHWIEPVARDTPKSKQHHVWGAVGLLEWHKERSKT